MQFSKLIPAALLVLSNLALAVDTVGFNALAKWKSGMQPGHAYAFKTGPSLPVGHQRLIIARITGSPGNRDATAEMCQISCNPETGHKYCENMRPGEWVRPYAVLSL